MVVTAHPLDHCRPLQQLFVVQLLFAELDDVHASCDAGFDEVFEVGPVRSAQVQPATGQSPSVG